MGIPLPPKIITPLFGTKIHLFQTRKWTLFLIRRSVLLKPSLTDLWNPGTVEKNQNYKFNYKEWNTGCELMIIWFFQNCKSIYCLYWLHWIRQPPLVAETVLLGSFPLKVTANTQLEMYPTSLLSMCGHVNYVLSLLIFSNHFFLEPKYISYFQTTYLKEKIVKNQLWKI